MKPEVRTHDTTLRGLRVHWAEAGDGPPLLLVHGFIVSHKEWLPTLPHLASRFRCIVPDLPGSGASDKRAPGQYPYTREAFAETLRALLTELGIERTHVAGHSLGGGIALTLAADHPEVVDRLAVLDSLSFTFPLSPKARLPLLPVVGGLIFKRLYKRPLFRDYFVNDVYSGHDTIDLARVDEYYEDFAPMESREAAYATMQRAATDTTTLEPRIARVKAPTLVLWGEDDRIFPVSLAHRLVRELPDARLEVIAGAAHAPNEEFPERTAERLLAHFGGADAAADRARASGKGD